MPRVGKLMVEDGNYHRLLIKILTGTSSMESNLAICKKADVLTL